MRAQKIPVSHIQQSIPMFIEIDQAYTWLKTGIQEWGLIFQGDGFSATIGFDVEFVFFQQPANRTLNFILSQTGFVRDFGYARFTIFIQVMPNFSSCVTNYFSHIITFRFSKKIMVDDGT
jgi:hypothetical protein